MTTPMRYKRATAALDETARARLWGSVQVSPERLQENSPELEEMVGSFYDEVGDEQPAGNRGGDAGDGGYTAAMAAVMEEVAADPVADRIRAETEAAVRFVESAGPDGLKRRVMGRLRDVGFDAGLCKSSWDKATACPAGTYEFIEVVASNGTRFIVDINIAGEFEIARPTKEYVELLGSLPQVFVGRPETLKGVLRVMCDAAKDSMKKAGMHVPPWRRKEYVHVKWFSPFQRSTTSSSRSQKVGSVCNLELACTPRERQRKLVLAFKSM